MTQRQVQIINRLGLHARAAAKLVHTANSFRSQIFVGTSEEEVNARLKQIMVNSFKDVWDRSRKEGLPMRQSAYVLAVDRVATVVKTRGIFP